MVPDSDGTWVFRLSGEGTSGEKWHNSLVSGRIGHRKLERFPQLLYRGITSVFSLGIKCVVHIYCSFHLLITILANLNSV